jgi:hypothetical protein
MDMIFNMFVDPNYFGIDRFRKNRVHHFDQAKFCKYGFGSFKMWCDVVSTAALLYDISYINLHESEEEIVQLTIDQYGYLVRNIWINRLFLEMIDKLTCLYVAPHTGQCRPIQPFLSD